MKKNKKALHTALLFLVCVTCMLVAACNKTVYTFEFDTNGGSIIESAEVEEGKEYVLPIPEKDGYGFEGWFVSADFEGSPVEKAKADASRKFYAKWSKLYKLSLDAKGGEVSETELFLKEGDSIKNALNGLIPEKSGLSGVWFDGEREVSSLAVMPAADKSLYAKYRVGYTVEAWEQNIDLKTYGKKTYTEYGYVGDSVEAETERTGFTYAVNENEIKDIVLTEDAASNTLKLYFDRNTYTLTYYPNYPAGAETGAVAPVAVQVIYGVEVAVGSGFYSAEGYIFAGWAVKSDGNAEYKTDYLETAIENPDGEPSGTDIITPQKNMSLFAVWVKGCVDMFGGSDCVFQISPTDENIYLSRGGKLFKGIYNAETNLFVFKNADGDILLKGKFTSEGIFTYYNSTRGEGAGLTLFVSGEGLKENTKIYFDAYNGIKYTVSDAAGMDESSEGTYLIEDDLYFTATFSSGSMAGETITFVTGYVQIDNVTTSAFQIRSDEEYGLGELVRFGVSETYIGVYGIYELTLDGLGGAEYALPDSTLSLRYTKDGDIVTLRETDGALYGRAMLIKQNGQNGYLVYDQDLDNTFTAADGSSLELDGAYLASYTIGDKMVVGNYVIEKSAFPDKRIVTMYAAGGIYKFLINITVKTVEGADGENTTEASYTFEKKKTDYSEFYFKNDSGVYYIPLLVMHENDAESNIAFIYSFDKENKYVKAGRGSVSYNAATKRYAYTNIERYDVELKEQDVDLLKVDSFEFSIDVYQSVTGEAWDSLVAEYNVSYWFAYTDTDGKKTEYEKIYTSADGAVLSITAGFAKYTDGDVTVEGEYELKNGILTIVSDSSAVYLSLNSENDTFEKLDYAPFTAYVMFADGSADADNYIVFDGKGGALYTEIKEIDGVGSETIYAGKVTEQNKTTPEGAYIYLFGSDTLSFEFIQLSTSTNNYISKFNEAYNGTYTSANGTLTLDGFSFYLSYTDSDGNNYTGRYIVEKENVIYMFNDNTQMYFDFTSDGKFKVRGSEYGTYRLMRNRSFDEIIFDFDGYGNMKVYTEDAEGNVESYIDENGTYTVSGKTFTLKYADGIDQFVLKGELSVVTVYSYDFDCFIVSNEDMVRTFIMDSDWSVLKLDNFGNAVRFDETGLKEDGFYTLITDNILYYVNSASSDACLYDYDIETGKAQKITYEVKGYYTSDLQSLVFTEYGFAKFGASSIYYYTVDGEGTVTVYRRGETGEQTNSYGFVAQEFGVFEEEMIYGGQTYYYNSGYAINFSRKDGATDYPIIIGEDRLDFTQLLFAPTGEDEFTVSGIIKHNDDSYSCNVVRETDDENNVSMYVTIDYYRLDIDVEYKGQTFDGSGDSSFTVTGLSYSRAYISYAFMDLYYQIYSLYGSTLANLLSNTFGTISFIREYDADGAVKEDYLTGAFGEASRMYDSTGNIVSFDKVSYSNTDSGLYTIDTVAADGYTYSVHFIFATHRAFGITGYYVYAFTRTETVPANDGFTVETERVISSDAGLTEGALYTISLKLNDNLIEGELALNINGSLYYIVRERGENDVIASSTYYKIALVEKTASGPIENDKKLVALYESATVTAETMTVVYSEDGASFVEISSDKGVMILSAGDVLTYAVESVYDADTATYTVVAANGKTYTVKVENNKAVIEDVTAEEKN